MEQIHQSVIQNDPERHKLWTEILQTIVDGNPIYSIQNYPLLYQLVEFCRNDLKEIHHIVRSGGADGKGWKSSQELLFAMPVFFQARKMQENELIISQIPAEANVGMYVCKFCGSSDTTTKMVQIRSADEPMTLYITCNSCGRRSRIG
jgi:hypothetical protein